MVYLWSSGRATGQGGAIRREAAGQLSAHVHSGGGSGAALFASAGGGAGSRRGGRSGRPPGSLRVLRARNTARAEGRSVKDVLATPVKDVLALNTSGGHVLESTV